MEKLIVEIEVEGKSNATTFEVEGRDLPSLLQRIKVEAGLGDEVGVFERDKDEELGGDLGSRKALSVVVSKCKKVMVEVQFEQHTISDAFPPSATIFRVLRWAVSKKEFNLDDTAKAKANLMLPGGDTPLARDAPISRFLDGKVCTLTFVLTLKDFTNG